MMDAKLQRRIQRYGWDKAVSYYEQCWKQQLEPAHTHLLALAALQGGERVLDVACGTGLVSFRAAASVGPEGAVVGTDISENMVECARAMAAQPHLRHTTFARMDAEDLRLPDGTFDVALCALGLMYVPHPVRALQEISRVLKPGGRAVAVVWGQRDRCGWAEIFPIVEMRVHSEVCPLFFQLGAKDILAQTFQVAGFKDIVSERLSTVLHYTSATDACGAAFAGGPVALAYSRFDARTRQAAHAEYLAAIAAYGTGGGYAIPGEFVVVRGSKR
jgi:ubiquinone/menaquinone biosynthesis C-methylase UbiE